MLQVSGTASEQQSADFLFRCSFGATEQIKPDSVIWVTYLLMTQLIQNLYLRI